MINWFKKGDQYSTEKKKGPLDKLKEAFNTSVDDRTEQLNRATGTGAGAGLLAHEAPHTAGTSGMKHKN